MGIFSIITHISTDILILGALAAAFFIFMLRSGKRGAVSVVIAFYPTLVFYNALPFFDKLIFWDDAPFKIFANKLLVFAIIWALFFTLIRMAVHVEFPYSNFRKLIQTIVLSAAALVLVFILIQSIIPINEVYSFLPALARVFSEEFIFWWLLAPWVALFAVLKR